LQRTDKIFQACKPNSVIPQNGMAIIYLVRMLPSGSSSLPGDHRSEQPRSGYTRTISLLGLASGVVCHASSVTIGAVGSYPAFSPLSGKSQTVYFLWHYQ